MNFDALVARNAPTACKGILNAVGMCGSVIVGVAIGLPALSPFAAFGAMLAMHITPRHGATARIVGAAVGCVFLLLAASLSQALAAYPLLALAFLFGLSWLGALPRQQLAYLGFVGKFAAVAVLLGYFDFTPSLLMGLYFCGGILLGLLLSLANMAFEQEDQQGPLEQLRALLHGGTNNPWFSLLVPLTVVASSLLARALSFTDPAWVGLTVIFVATADISHEYARLLNRIIGTIAGAFISYAILSHVHEPLRLALVVGLLAFFIPFVLKRYWLFCLLMTCIVLMLLDIAMFSQGGDMGLLFWRCVDTVCGCLCVLLANAGLLLLHRLTSRRGSI